MLLTAPKGGKMDIGFYISTHPQIILMIIWPIALILLFLAINNVKITRKEQLRHADDFNHNCSILEAMGSNAIPIEKVGFFTTFDRIFNAPRIDLTIDDLNKPCPKCDKLFKDVHEIFFDLKENRFRILAKENMVCF
jgi:hypothetical protein